MDMIQSRNLTSHTDNEETAAQIAAAILSDYFPEFEALYGKLSVLDESEAEET